MNVTAVCHRLKGGAIKKTDFSQRHAAEEQAANGHELQQGKFLLDKEK